MGEENKPETTDPVLEEGGVSSVGPSEIEVDESDVPQEKPVEQQREDVRMVLTVLLFLLLVGQLGLAGLGAAFLGETQWMQLEDYLRLTVPGTFGLLGSAIGFYFGSQR